MNDANQELAFDQLDKASGGVYRPPHFTHTPSLHTHAGRANFNRQMNAAVKSLISSIGNFHF